MVARIINSLGTERSHCTSKAHTLLQRRLDTAELNFHVASNRCYAKKFRRRLQRRSTSAREALLLDDALKEHQMEMKRTSFSTGREGNGEMCCVCNNQIYGILCCNGMDEWIHWGCGRLPKSTKTNRNSKCSIVTVVRYPRPPLRVRDNGKPQLWLLWSILFFGCFHDLHDNRSTKVDTRTKPSVVFADSLNASDNHLKFSAVSTNTRSGNNSCDETSNRSCASASWLSWSQTRSQVFGLFSDPWDEDWCTDLIFGAQAENRQRYLWTYLAKGLHKQCGMGERRIPSAWKLRRRAKQRSYKDQTFCTLRGGGLQHEANTSSSSSKDMVIMSSEISHHVLGAADFRNGCLQVSQQKLSIR